jgi:DNA-binding IclR family transcriptional regulator
MIRKEMIPISQVDKYRIKSLDKAISILELMAVEKRELTLTEIAQGLKMGKGTVHRFLNTLKTRKFIQQDAGTKKYGFGIRAFDLGTSVRKETHLKSILLPKLRHVAAECRESANAAVLEYDEIVYIIHLESEETLRFFTHEGIRLPAHCTAMGKILLSSLPTEALARMFSDAERLKGRTKYSISSFEQLMKTLAEVRKKGLAYDREECYLGICCLAAPIRDYKNDVIAAISISAPKIRMGKERIAELGKLLQRSAEEISKEF